MGFRRFATRPATALLLFAVVSECGKNRKGPEGAGPRVSYEELKSRKIRELLDVVIGAAAVVCSRLAVP